MLDNLYIKIMNLAWRYDDLARHLLHAKPVSFNQWMVERSRSHFDIYENCLSAAVEVKAHSNMDQFKLFESQINSQQEELGFPFDHGFNLMFDYRNCKRVDGKMVRMFDNEVKTEGNVIEFLADNTLCAYAVSTNLLSAFLSCNGTKTYKREEGHSRQRLILNREDLKDFALNVRSGLSRVGMESELSRWLPHNATSIPTRRVQTEFHGHRVCFDLYPLLPQRLRKDFLNQLNGAVVKC